ncbi:hypothetical protein [Enterovirga rhinocerotis]|uniref:DUF1833 domain-containing protein n=1 Tax=Enterovirga rhinocerotis TaxID=1339210 RepID=A0A4R7C1B6_9HYPH|nr:hypothetical protein [Enterovirga rhinocerotis]TDR90287.1 hypothetical protein EV668_3133 [Enterovirga rhinocerotis]
MSIYDAAMREANSSGGFDKTVVQTIELSHVGFTVPVRLAMVIGEPQEVESVVSLRLEDNSIVDHALCFFSFIRPGAEKDGPTEGRLRIDGASSQIYAQLKSALDYDEPIRATVREYVIGSAGLAALGKPNSVIPGLEFEEASLDGASAEGKLEYVDGSNLNVPTGPNAFFDRDNFPTLYT